MTAYGIVHPAGIALRASFLIDENFDVRHQVVNDLPLGRNVDEMLLSNWSFVTPQSGHTQSSGISSHFVPGAIPSFCEPLASS
jgi:hypothetical protein